MAGVKRVPIASIRHKVHLSDLAHPGVKGASFAGFLDSLPRQLAAEDLRALVEAIVAAHREGRAIIWGMGAHVIKCGLSSLVIDLMLRGLITGVALNGAGAIHDVELALAGETSEDVAAGLDEGVFGMAEETGAFFCRALAGSPEPGLGHLVGKALLAEGAPHAEQSILAQGAALGVPVTVHVALGTDTIHMHPGINAEALGAATMADFRLLAAEVADMDGGGVYLNVGSAVLLPEVFLKGLTLARNLGHRVAGFTTANLDMLQHYRPLQNVVRRPAGTGGRGYTLTGHHEIMVPLLAQAILEKIP
ncbi:MAG: hypothetical protein HY677_01650 [Chloroflexi bacterium]|nr:hypothetical protein [Chloroflexota bacterium]